MESEVEKLFSHQVRAEAAHLFGAEADALELLGDFENYVFGYEKEGQQRVLRISHPSHRTRLQIEAELHWVDYLADAGVRVARPIGSTQGALLHTIELGAATFHVCAFERMPGRHPQTEDWTPELFRNWGQFLGRCHSLSVGYEPPPDLPRRHTRMNDPYVLQGRDWIPEAKYREQWDRVWTEIAGLSQDVQHYGVCHTDLHQSNFHVDGGRIHAFDTDDCCYCWFVEDISSVFFYGAKHPASGADVKAFFDWSWPAFWAGYRSEHRLDPEWLDRVHLFQRARELILYAVAHKKFEPGHEWRERFLAHQRPRLDSERPILDVEYRDLPG